MEHEEAQRLLPDSPSGEAGPHSQLPEKKDEGWARRRRLSTRGGERTRGAASSGDLLQPCAE